MAKDKAVAKIRAEMEGNKDNPNIQVIGDFLLKHLESNPPSVEKILQEDKTIVKSIEEMGKEARKNQTGNYAVLPDQEGFAIVLKYFGIDSNAAPTTPPEKSNAFDINLSDLL